MCKTRYPLRILSGIFFSFMLIFLAVRLNVKLPFRKGKESKFHCICVCVVVVLCLWVPNKFKYATYSIQEIFIMMKSHWYYFYDKGIFYQAPIWGDWSDNTMPGKLCMSGIFGPGKQEAKMEWRWAANSYYFCSLVSSMFLSCLSIKQ